MQMAYKNRSSKGPMPFLLPTNRTVVYALIVLSKVVINFVIAFKVNWSRSLSVSLNIVLQSSLRVSDSICRCMLTVSLDFDPLRFKVDSKLFDTIGLAIYVIRFFKSTPASVTISLLDFFTSSVYCSLLYNCSWMSPYWCLNNRYWLKFRCYSKILWPQLKLISPWPQLRHKSKYRTAAVIVESWSYTSKLKQTWYSRHHQSWRSVISFGHKNIWFYH